jgi:hypothetical protein
MSWKKYFKVADTSGQFSPIGSGATTPQASNFAFRNYQSKLPEVYTGHPNRVERYNQYEAMDMDSEVNACLDIISEFSTQADDVTASPFDINYVSKPTDNEVNILAEQLAQWVKLNKFNERLFKMFRNTIKYGDQVFIRDPETFKLMWVEPTKVARVIVNESKGKEPEQYVVTDINPNFENLTVAAKTVDDFAVNPGRGGYTANNQAPVSGGNLNNNGSRFANSMKESVIDAKHVVHLSLTEGLDVTWPFGTSILENIYKVFKQKEMLEDAILIYRIQRAPERRVFYIDVGNMPSHMAMSFVERVKNEIHQRRIPTQNGGANTMDATYNPLSTNEDFFFPQTAEGRGSKVDTLPGGENLGQIDDLRYFNNKLARGLRVPSSYLPSGPDDSSSPLTDGRLGTALIQEFRFNQYCKRIQASLARVLNTEFKLYLAFRGFNIDSGLFDIKFNEPQNFASYRQSELDATRVSTFANLEQYPYLSKRFLLERYLGLTEEEMVKNEEQWEEENAKAQKTSPEGSDLRGVGVMPGGFESDIDMMGEIEGMDDMDSGGMDDMGGANAELNPMASEAPPMSGGDTAGIA